MVRSSGSLSPSAAVWVGSTVEVLSQLMRRSNVAGCVSGREKTVFLEVGGP